MPDNAAPLGTPDAAPAMYHTIGSASDMCAKLGQTVNSIEPLSRAQANAQPNSSLHQWRYIAGGTSVRDGFSKLDYEFFRPNEALPRRMRDIISFCMASYERIGLVKNIIDLMGDFGSQGIRIVHEDPETEEFYNKWFKKVKGQERSERILNMLYRTGNVIIKRKTARVKNSEFSDLKKGMAAKYQGGYRNDLINRVGGPDIKKLKNHKKDLTPTVEPGELPWTYYIMNPLSLELVSNDLAVFSDIYYYGIRITPIIKNAINNPKNDQEKAMVDSIPSDIKDAIDREQKLLMLDPGKISAIYYKKDDWMPWAYPMLFCVLDDLNVYSKLKLADLTALDGCIQHIRIWKLGSLEHKIIPTDAAIAKLSSMLMNTSGNGNTLDLIWGPELEYEETSTEAHKFLGSEKYRPILEAIYAGLGIPQMLTGTQGGAGGMTYNFLQIKTFIERLQYGRDRLTEFWTQEINLVRQGMKGYSGFNWKVPPVIAYNHMSLTDEASMTKLIMDLCDREIISIQTAQEQLDIDPKIETSRLKNESKGRDSGEHAPKVSPFHDSQPALSKEKIFAQRGHVTPSEVGVTLKPRVAGEKSALEMQAEQATKVAETKLKGQPGEGRPKNAKDTKKRKQRIPLVANEIETFVWAQGALSEISDMLLPAFKEKFAKANVRQFSNAEHKEFETFKRHVLFNIEALAEITPETIQKASVEPLDSESFTVFDIVLNGQTGKVSTETERQLTALAYANINCTE